MQSGRCDSAGAKVMLQPWGADRLVPTLVLRLPPLGVGVGGAVLR
jgi:hypothetical protein